MSIHHDPLEDALEKARRKIEEAFGKGEKSTWHIIWREAI